MRTTIYGLALLGAALSAPAALAQTSPAAPDRNPPAATMQDSTRPATPAPAPADRSGATTVGPTTEGGQSAVRVDEGTRTAGTPQPGANSFTEGQARSRIEAAGFSDVTELQKDDQGIWRGRARRGGQQTSVALDFTGAVTSR
jgi:hypothetical protein